MANVLKSKARGDAQASGWETLPLFPDLSPCSPLFTREDAAEFSDPFLAELAMSTPVQRLKGIGFLGAIDYVKSPNGHQSYRRRHSRFDHSVGVAELALLYTRLCGVSLKEARVLAAAGLLHDIGHGPLSHTLEPIFYDVFGLTHHKSGVDILYGRSPLGNEISKTMSTYQVDLDEVTAMIAGNHAGPLSHLFAGPINLDTIEGICRSRAFMIKSHRPIDPGHLVASMAKSRETFPIEAMDDFWTLKGQVYNLIIHHPWCLIFDGLAQAYMNYRIDNFGPSDFIKTEDELRYKEPGLFHLFAWTKTSKRRTYHRVSELFPKVLDYKVRAPQRTFSINKDVLVGCATDLERRYTQETEYRSVTIRALLAEAQSYGEIA